MPSTDDAESRPLSWPSADRHEPEPFDFGPRWSVAVRSLAGTADRARENQDNYLLIDAHGRAAHLLEQREVRRGPLPNWRVGHARVAILDGMGGHGQGREVAEAVVQGLLQVPACPDLDALCSRLDALHDDLHRRFACPGDVVRSSPGTTLTLLELPPTGPALLYHVGDSRLFQITADQCIPLTVDHVPATGHLLRQHVDEEDWRHHVYERDGSELSQAFVLGSTLLDPDCLRPGLTPLRAAQLPPSLAGLEDRRTIEIQEDMLFVMATDGLWASQAPGPWLGRWVAVFNKPGKPLHTLVDELLTEFILSPPAGLRDDNCTVLALKAAHRV